MSSYNDIGIDNTRGVETAPRPQTKRGTRAFLAYEMQPHTEVDWQRIRKLMVIGILAGCTVMIGDMLLGWGVHDSGKTGLEGFLSAYLDISDRRIF